MGKSQFQSSYTGQFPEPFFATLSWRNALKNGNYGSPAVNLNNQQKSIVMFSESQGPAPRSPLSSRYRHGNVSTKGSYPVFNERRRALLIQGIRTQHKTIYPSLPNATFFSFPSSHYTSLYSPLPLLPLSSTPVSSSSLSLLLCIPLPPLPPLYLPSLPLP